MLRRIVAAVSILFTAVAAQAAETAPDAASKRLIEARAVEAVIWGMPAVNYDLMLQEFKKIGGKENQIVYWSDPLDGNNQTLTPNPDSMYFMAFYNTKDGPVVLEIPPAGDDGSINANIVTTWQMPLADGGPYGTDKGQGGKYLLLPPGYSGEVQEGYIPLQSDTYGGYALIRSNLKSHGDADVAKSVAYGKRVKLYPLPEAANPPGAVFVDAADVVFDSTIHYDASFFDRLNRIVQDEPWIRRDRAMIDQLKTIGIEKGKRFSPDAEMKAIFDEAAQQAKVLLESRFDAGFPPFFEGTHWTLPVASPELVKAMQSGFSDSASYPIDARGLAYTYAFVGIKNLGAGQYYLFNIKDKDGAAYDGGKNYRLHVPANPPVKQYWSVTVYDRELHTLLRGVKRASRASNAVDVQKNEDGSVDVYFGPEPPPGKESNWVPTKPGQGFEFIFRLYAPTEALFDKTWKLPDVEKVN
jgi:hypothetical protein